MTPAQVVLGDGMAPMHVVPDPAMRVMLAKQMRPPPETAETVRIVHPAEGRAEIMAPGKSGGPLAGLVWMTVMPVSSTSDGVNQ